MRPQDFYDICKILLNRNIFNINSLDLNMAIDCEKNIEKLSFY